MSLFIDLTDQHFGRLKAIKYVGKNRWLVHCACGVEKTVQGSSLRGGDTKSCGCIRKEWLRSGKTNQCASRYVEYFIRNAIINRCTSEFNERWANYGGRGIDVCDRWRHGEAGLGGFQCFLADMGRRPSPKHCLGRIDKNGDFTPNNCKWMTRSEINVGRKARRR